MQYEEYRAAQRSAGDNTKGQTKVKIVSWLPVKATSRREPNYAANAISAEPHRATTSASLTKASLPPARLRLRDSAAGKPGEGNSMGNDRLLLLPVVDGAVRVDNAQT